MARRLQNIGDSAALVVADAVTSLPDPPSVFGVVPDSWGTAAGVIPTLDVHFRADGAQSLSVTKVYAGRRFGSADLVDADLKSTDVNATTNAFAETAHGYLTGDGPFTWLRRAALDLATLAAGAIDLVVEAIEVGADGNDVSLDIVFDASAGPTLSEVGDAVTLHVKNGVTTNSLLAAVLNTSTVLRVRTDTVTGGHVLSSASDNFAATNLINGSDAPTNVPGGTSADVDYWISVVDADHFKLAASIADAITGGATVDLTDVGSADFVLTASSDVRRFYWSLLGSLGTIALDEQLAATVSIDHRPTTVAYAVTATFATGAAVTIQFDPVAEVEG